MYMELAPLLGALVHGVIVIEEAIVFYIAPN